MVQPRETIEIEGNLVQLIERRVVRSLTLDDLYPHLAVPGPWTTPRLPKDTALFHIDPTTRMFYTVVELEFGLKTFTTAGARRALRLMMPYTIFVFWAEQSARGDHWVLRDVYAFWSRDHITGWDSPVIDAQVPNVYSSGRICFGSTATEGNRDLNQRIDATVNGFYQSSFNRDLGWRKPSKYRSYAEWAIDSRNDPNAWRQWDEWSLARPLNAWALGHRFDPTSITVEGTIPAYTPGASYGRAAEWFENLPAIDRYRLVEGIRHALPRVGMEVPTEMNFETEDLATLDTLPERPTRTPRPRPEPEILDDETNFGEITYGDQPEEDNDDEPLRCQCADNGGTNAEGTLCGCMEIIPEYEASTTCGACRGGDHI